MRIFSPLPGLRFGSVVVEAAAVLVVEKSLVALSCSPSFVQAGMSTSKLATTTATVLAEIIVPYCSAPFVAKLQRESCAFHSWKDSG